MTRNTAYQFARSSEHQSRQAGKTNPEPSQAQGWAFHESTAAKIFPVPVFAGKGAWALYLSGSRSLIFPYPGGWSPQEGQAGGRIKRGVAGDGNTNLVLP
jgi:hypothetical protein